MRGFVLAGKMKIGLQLLSTSTSDSSKYQGRVLGKLFNLKDSVSTQRNRYKLPMNK